MTIISRERESLNHLLVRIDEILDEDDSQPDQQATIITSLKDVQAQMDTLRGRVNSYSPGEERDALAHSVEEALAGLNRSIMSFESPSSEVVTPESKWLPAGLLDDTPDSLRGLSDKLNEKLGLSSKWRGKLFDDEER